MGTMYQTGIQNIVDGTAPWATATDRRVALCTSGYSANPDHDDMADITNELSGGNYARVAAASESIALDDANNECECTCGNTTFTSLGAAAGTPAVAIWFVYNASDANAILTSCNTLTSPPVPNGGDYVIQPSAEGIIKFTVV